MNASQALAHLRSLVPWIQYIACDKNGLITVWDTRPTLIRGVWIRENKNARSRLLDDIFVISIAPETVYGESK